MDADKVSFTRDPKTIQQSTAKRLDRLSEPERTALLKAFDELVPQIEARSSEEVDQELADVRRARRSGGRGPRF